MDYVGYKILLILKYQDSLVYWAVWDQDITYWIIRAKDVERF